MKGRSSFLSRDFMMLCWLWGSRSVLRVPLSVSRFVVVLCFFTEECASLLDDEKGGVCQRRAGRCLEVVRSFPSQGPW